MFPNSCFRTGCGTYRTLQSYITVQVEECLYNYILRGVQKFQTTSEWVKKSYFHFFWTQILDEYALLPNNLLNNLWKMRTKAFVVLLLSVSFDTIFSFLLKSCHCSFYKATILASTKMLLEIAKLFPLLWPQLATASSLNLFRTRSYAKIWTCRGLLQLILGLQEFQIVHFPDRRGSMRMQVF